MNPSTDHVELARQFALITRGKHSGWTGDRIANSDHFAFCIGLESDEASELVRSLGIAETQYSLLTGLPPGSLRRMSAQIKAGIRSRRSAHERARAARAQSEKGE